VEFEPLVPEPLGIVASSSTIGYARTIVFSRSHLIDTERRTCYSDETDPYYNIACTVRHSVCVRAHPVGESVRQSLRPEASLPGSDTIQPLLPGLGQKFQWLQSRFLLSTCAPRWRYQMIQACDEINDILIHTDLTALRLVSRTLFPRKSGRRAGIEISGVNVCRD